MKIRKLFSFLLLFILAACSSDSRTVVSDEAAFHGEGDYWNVKYTYDAKLYKDKKISWVDIEMKDSRLTKGDLDNIEIQLESRDGTISGNLGEMAAKIKGNAVSFLVGTVNSTVYTEDEFQITVNYKEKQDVIKLKY